jgi:hypothetical protein
MVAEFRSSGSARSLRLKPGRYFVRARGDNVLWEGDVQVDRGQTTTLDVSTLDQIEYARLARKGGSDHRTSTVGPTARVSVRSPLTGTIPCIGGTVGVEVVLSSVVLAPRVGACVEEFSSKLTDGTTLTAQTVDVELTLAALYAVDLPWGIAVFAGPEVGASYLHQRFSTVTARAPANNLFGPHVGVDAGLAWNLPWGLTPQLLVVARTNILPVQRPGGASAVAALFSAGLGVGVTKFF